MARPTKQGIDYFPIDVDILQDMKVRRLVVSLGPASFAILLCIFGLIFKDKGYYMEWNDTTRFMVADSVKAEPTDIDETVLKAVEFGLFNKQLYNEHNVLTSHGIQSIYHTAVGRRKKIELFKEIIVFAELLQHDVNNNEVFANIDQTKTTVNVDKNPVNVDKSTQSKVKESKVNKSKVNESKGKNIQHAVIQDIIQYINPASPILIERVYEDVDTYGEEWCKNAFELARYRGTTNWSYVQGILRNWSANFGLNDKPWEVERNGANQRHESSSDAGSYPARKNKRRNDGSGVDWAAEPKGIEY